MLEQVCDPFGIFEIRLSPRHRFDMLGVDHHHLHIPFQDIEDGSPEHTRTLQRPPLWAGVMRQAMTDFLWTSRPAQRSYTICMSFLLVIQKHSKAGGPRDPERGSNSPIRASPLLTSDRLWCLEGSRSYCWSGSER